jgi:hypothetical protein
MSKIRMRARALESVSPVEAPPSLDEAAAFEAVRVHPACRAADEGARGVPGAVRTGRQMGAAAHLLGPPAVPFSTLSLVEACRRLAAVAAHHAFAGAMPRSVRAEAGSLRPFHLAPGAAVVLGAVGAGVAGPGPVALSLGLGTTLGAPLLNVG